jgi:ferredoxin
MSAGDSNPRASDEKIDARSDARSESASRADAGNGQCATASATASGAVDSPAASPVPLVRVEPLGRTFEAPPELTLLEAAAFAGIRLPRLCRNGTCRTCLCRVVSGEASFTIEWPGLSREEKAEGYVLSCVAVARTDLVLDVPEAELL